jgi:hypothetical protein
MEKKAILTDIMKPNYYLSSISKFQNKYGNDHFVISYMENKDNYFQFHVMDIKDINVLLRQRKIIDEAIVNTIVYHNTEFKIYDGKKNEKLLKMFERIGFPPISKATMNLNIVDPVDNVIRYVVTGWKKEDMIGFE